MTDLNMYVAVFLLVSFIIGVRDYEKWRTREEGKRNALINDGYNPPKSRRIFGLHNLFFIPSLLVFYIGKAIYNVSLEW